MHVLLQEVLEKIKKDQAVASHFGPDLDQRATVETLRRALQLDELTVEFVPAGKAHDRYVTVDSGKADGIEQRGESFVVDTHGGERFRNCLEVLKEYGIEETGVKIPDQLLALADKIAENIPFSDFQTGLSLQRYAKGEQVWRMAEDGVLDHRLTEEQLAQYGLTQARDKQKSVVEKAFSEVEKNRTGHFVVVDHFVPGGSLAAYESGALFYASSSPHASGEGITFGVTAKPGEKIPASLVDALKEMAPDVFVAPSGEMLVLGGPKNPEVHAKMTHAAFQEVVETHLVSESTREVRDALAQTKTQNIGAFVHVLKEALPFYHVDGETDVQKVKHLEQLLQSTHWEKTSEQDGKTVYTAKIPGINPSLSVDAVENESLYVLATEKPHTFALGVVDPQPPLSDHTSVTISQKDGWKTIEKIHPGEPFAVSTVGTTHLQHGDVISKQEAVALNFTKILRLSQPVERDLNKEQAL